MYKTKNMMTLSEFENMNHIILMAQFFDINKSIKFWYELYDWKYIWFVKEEYILNVNKKVPCKV